MDNVTEEQQEHQEPEYFTRSQLELYGEVKKLRSDASYAQGSANNDRDGSIALGALSLVPLGFAIYETMNLVSSSHEGSPGMAAFLWVAGAATVCGSYLASSYSNRSQERAEGLHAKIKELEANPDFVDFGF